MQKNPCSSLLIALTIWILGAAAHGQQEAPHVVFVVGEGEYKSEVSMPALAERLEETWGWRTTVLLDEVLHTGDDNHVPGLEVLADADLVVLFLRFRRWPQQDLDALATYVETGRPLAAFRTTTHAFNYDGGDPRVEWNRFGAKVLGAPWIRHYGHGASTNAAVVGRGADDGILDGVADEFHVRSWTYHVRPDYPPEDARVLVHGTPVLPGKEGTEVDPRTVNPIAWTRTNSAGGRVFMTTMGHPEDFRSTAFRRLIGNGLHWALAREIPDETLSDFPAVTHPDDEEQDEGGGPWQRMDYGPFVSTAVSIGDDLPPVHKGVVVRLRTRDGEQTDLHAVFDTDLVAWRCVWEGELALRGIVYDGPHGVFPEIEGEPLFRMGAVPGVAFSADQLKSRDDPRDEPWGPLAPALARWSGLHLDGDDVVFEYTAGDGRTRILERVWAEPGDAGFAFVREIATESAEAVGTLGPLVRLFEPRQDAGGSVPHLSLGSGDFSAWTLTDGIFQLMANRTALIAIAHPDAGEPIRPALPADRVQDALARSRPRWGEALTTRGVIDDQLESEEAARQVIHLAGAGAQSVNVVSAEGGRLELLADGAPVQASSVQSALILRSPSNALEGSELERFEEDELLGWWRADAGSGTHETNAYTNAADLRLDGVTWRRGIVGRSLDFDGTAAAWLDALSLDLFAQDLTVSVWIHTTSDGTVFSVGPPEGSWKPDGATLFLREGRLSFDIGWVGVVSGGPRIDDGGWHHVAAIWRHEGGDVRLFVDGERVAAGRLKLAGEEHRLAFVPRFGWTNENFPAVSRFSGYMEGLHLLARAVRDESVLALAERTGEPLCAGTVVRWSGDAGTPAPALRLASTGTTTSVWLDLPAVAEDAAYELLTRRGPRSTLLAWAERAARDTGPARPFRIDRLTWPEDNPYHSWMRFGAFDFLPSASGTLTSAMITTWSGDLWRVDGLDEDLDELRWTRVATGLNQPFGVVTRATPGGPAVYVLGRDQITRVHDENGDGEADFLENFANSIQNSEHFHEPASGLQVAPDGSLLLIKAARHAKHALHDHHGAVLRLSPDGRRTEVVARGFRAPLGLTLLPDGSLLGSDQEGHWTPANRINLIRPSAEDPPFFGNGWAARNEVLPRVERNSEDVQPAWDGDAAYVPPLCWLHPSVDRSPSSQVLANHPAWGPLEGALLGLSYGTGEVYLILRDDVQDADGNALSQGGIVKLGIQLPTGLLNGRIHPQTGDLYLCGLFGWSSDRTDPGGFYRVRPRAGGWSKSLNVPRRMRATAKGLELTFLHPLDPTSAQAAEHWEATAWNYRRTADYGSATYDLAGQRDARSPLQIRGVTLSADGRTARLEIEQFQPSMQLHVRWNISDASGRTLDHEAHLTVHALH